MKPKPRVLKGRLDLNLFEDFMESTKFGSSGLAMENPDRLSDEHAIWPERDFDAEERELKLINLIQQALQILSPREKEAILLSKNFTQIDAANHMIITRFAYQTLLTRAIKKIKKFVVIHQDPY